MKLRRWILTSAWIVAVPLVLLALFIAAERLRGWWELRRVTKALIQAGEKLSADALLVSPAKDNDAAMKLVEAAEEMKKNRLSNDPLRAMKMIAPGQALICHQQPVPVIKTYKSGQKEGPASWKEAGVELEKSRTAINQAKAALREPVVFAMDYGKGSVAQLPLSLSTLQYLTPGLTLDVLYQLHQGKLAEATESLNALARLPMVWNGMKFPVPLMFSDYATLISSQVMWEALQADGWNDELLKVLQGALSSTNAVDGAYHAFELELTAMDPHYRMLRESSEGRMTLMRMQEVDLVSLLVDEDLTTPEPNETVLWLRSTMWQMAWAGQDQACALRILGRRLRELRTLRANHNWQSCPLRDGSLGVKSTALDRWRRPMAGILTNRATARKIIREAILIETQRQLFVTAIALKRYSLLHGRHPENLDALTPSFLTLPPIDWMNGQLLRYRRNSDDTFCLYSVGEDGVDDGGNPAPMDATKKGIPSIDRGKDIVFPTASR